MGLKLRPNCIEEKAPGWRGAREGERLAWSIWVAGRATLWLWSIV